MNCRLLRFSRLRHCLCNAVAGLFLSISAVPVLADLMLYPTRIVFEGNQRAAQVELMNNASTPATYRISLVNRRMSDTGTFSAIEEPWLGEQFADSMLRYSPRQVTLAPGEGQTVRLMVRKPAGLKSGEYRSHLLFSRQPTAQTPRNVEDPKVGSDQIGVQITALVGASIPVIVRHGNTSASVAITDVNLRNDAAKPLLEFAIKREGNQSVYGDISVIFTPRNGQPEVLARANGVAVYTPNPVRRASISLPLKQHKALANGTLQLQYREQAEDGGDLLATALLVLP